MIKSKACSLKLLGIGLLISSAVLGETIQEESTGRWFLNPAANNWTCAEAPGKPTLAAAGKLCTGYPAKDNAFVRALPVHVQTVSGDRYYVYVSSWGQVNGPTSECKGDDTGIFEVPYSLNGLNGSAGVTYRGIATPCYTGSDPYPKRHVTSAFRDTTLQNKVYLVSGSMLGGPSILEWADSVDGLNFSWHKLLGNGIDTSETSFKLLSIVAQPVRSGVWGGFMSYRLAPPEYHAATPVEIDWTAGVIRYKTSPSAWSPPVAIGGNLTIMPWNQFNAAAESFDWVGGRWEVWLQRPALRSGLVPSPCDAAIYSANVSSSPTTQDTSAVVIDPAQSYASLSAELPLRSGVNLYNFRPMPPDFHSSLINARRFGDDMLYSGSKNYSICNYYLRGEPYYWSGSGIRFGRVVRK